MIPAETSPLWQYMSSGQQALLREGNYLLADLKQHMPNSPLSDYSFVVFPFAKAYEGFLKQLFFDLGMIKQWEYESDHLRIGKILSPHLQKMLRKRSMYLQLMHLTGSGDIPELLWQVWKRGRNMLFHYYPHNLSAITLAEAEIIIGEIVSAMEKGVELVKKYPRAVRESEKVTYYGKGRPIT